jgi:hypothetical protein
MEWRGVVNGWRGMTRQDSLPFSIYESVTLKYVLWIGGSHSYVSGLWVGAVTMVPGRNVGEK